MGISVSADGSTWFLGVVEVALDILPKLFQYPLMDRLGFWGQWQKRSRGFIFRFQYPLMDRLGFWGCWPGASRSARTGNFSIR